MLNIYMINSFITHTKYAWNVHLFNKQNIFFLINLRTFKNIDISSGKIHFKHRYAKLFPKRRNIDLFFLYF